MCGITYRDNFLRTNFYLCLKLMKGFWTEYRWLASRHSPRYRKIATTTTTTITTTTTFPFLLNLGLMDFDINFWDGDAHVYVCPLERGCSVVSEARQVTLDSWKFSKLRWSSWKLIGLKTEELLIHSERFVDSWIEETFVWILVAFFQG